MAYFTGINMVYAAEQAGRHMFWLQAEKITKEVNAIDPNKQILYKASLGDPFDYDTFFKGDYHNTMVLTTNIVNFPPELAKHVYSLNPCWVAIFCQDYPDLDVPIEKDFCCFMNRIEPNRQSWLYQLIRRNLLDRGFVSFNGLTRNPFKGMSATEAFEYSFQHYNSIFAVEHEKIKDKIPYKNFVEVNGDLLPQMLGSKFAIILETHFSDNRIITLSEKIFTYLQLPRPWILFSSQGSVDYIRKLGFDVLDDIIDHGYDNTADAIQRQVEILDQCQTLVDIDILNILPRCKQAAEHNKKIMLALKDNWAEKMLQEYKQAKQQCLSL